MSETTPNLGEPCPPGHHTKSGTCDCASCGYHLGDTPGLLGCPDDRPDAP